MTTNGSLPRKGVVRRIDFGDMRRFRPFCGNWGTTRGGPIDRYYIDAFIRAELRTVRGRFLECGGGRYRSAVPAARIKTYDVLDVDERVEGTTICADLQDMAYVPRSSYDVVICTQVLQYVSDPRRAVDNLRRVLKRGGLLLISVPFIERINPILGDEWRFTTSGLQRLLDRFSHISVFPKGNLFSSMCYLSGLGLDDVDSEDLAHTDEHFYQVVLAKAVR